MLGAALPAAAADPAADFARPALAAAAAALQPSVSSGGAAAAAAPAAAKCLAEVLGNDAAPAHVRAAAADLLGALAARDGAMAAPQLVARAAPSLRLRLDDANDGVRRAAGTYSRPLFCSTAFFVTKTTQRIPKKVLRVSLKWTSVRPWRAAAAALAALASTSRLAAHHAALAALQLHLISGEGDMRSAARTVLEAAHAAYPAVVHAAVERSGLAGERLRTSTPPTFNLLLLLLLNASA